MTLPIQVRLKVQESVNRFPIKVQSSGENVEIGVGTRVVAPYPDYDGAYEFTPSSSTQVIDTEKKLLRNDIVINPIPSNYGLISWNGSYLTVS